MQVMKVNSSHMQGGSLSQPGLSWVRGRVTMNLYAGLHAASLPEALGSLKKLSKILFNFCV